MELNVQDWKEFRLNKVFSLKGGFYNKKPEHSVVGTIPFLASTENNNGVTEYYSLNDIISWDKVGEPDNTLENKLFSGNSIAVTVNGSVCNAFYQKTQFTCSHDITQLCLRHHTMNEYIGQFLCVVIMMDKYRWNYGRKPHDVKKFGMSIIRLPIIHNPNETPFIDESRTFSDEGYIPDWQFMEDYIKSLHHKPITTKVKSGLVKELDVYNWEEFKVSDLFDRIYKAKAHTKEEVVEVDKGIHFVSRTDCNNGVDITVDKDTRYEGLEEANCITIGDTTATVFYQNERFIAGDHMVVLRANWLNLKRGLFFRTLFAQEGIRYCYGRAYRMDLIKSTLLKLPIQRDNDGTPVIDDNRTYSDSGYIPDWQYMEDYINSLPYSDRI
ncbi:MAG: restriction endonuclease subunit S [Candidatus Gastranaerophilales bacterium]|nr:restriction endonuclease subunit S [Candidatus Gastranaerophilales bacterium]